MKPEDVCHKRCSYRSDGEYDDVDGIKCRRWSREILYCMKTVAGMDNDGAGAKEIIFVTMDMVG